MEKITLIQQGIDNSTTVIIEYVDAKGQRTVREIEPYEFKNDGVYGYCLDKQGIRLFKLANIVGVDSTGNKFIKRY